MSFWNHRVIRTRGDAGNMTFLGIHEVYCDDKGRVWGTTKDPVSPHVTDCYGKGFEDLNETVEDLREILNHMLKACDHPILDMDSIPEDEAVSPSWTEEELDVESDE